MPPYTAVAPRKHSLDTLSIWALLITIAASVFVTLPFVSAPFTATKTFVMAGGALITLALYILARLGRGNIVFPPLLLVGALWLPLVAYLLSSVFSGVAFNNALWGVTLEPDTLGFMLVATVLGTLATLSVRRPEQYASLLRVLAYLFGAVVILQTLIVVLGQFMPSVISPAFSIFGSYADLASFLGLGVIGILVTLRFSEVSARTHQALLVILALSLFLLGVANMSLVWVLVALVSLGLFVESVMRRSSSAGDADLDDAAVMSEAPVSGDEGNHSLILPLVVLAVSLFFLIGNQLGSALASALNVDVLNVRPSWQSTLSVAQKTYATDPVFGSGPGTFGAEWLKHRDASLNSSVFWNVDFSSGIGFIPTSFVTTGIVGIIAWVAFLGLLIVLGLRMLIRRTPEDPFIRYASILSFVGAIYLFAIAVFDLPGSVILALAFVLAGLFISTARFATGGQQWGVIFARSPRIGFVIVFSLTIVLLSSVVAAYSLVGHYVATLSLTKASAALSRGALEEADRAVQSSIAFSPSPLAYQLQAGIANAQLSVIAASTTMEKGAAQQAYQSALSVGINAALTGTKLDPSNYQNWLALGNLYAQAVPLEVEGAYDSAKTAYMKAVELNPTNPQIPFILAQLDIAHKDTKSAEAHLRDAIALKQDYTEAIFLLSQLEVQNGNVKGALTSALAAAYFTPNDPNILFQVGILYAAQAEYANAAAALEAAVAANPQFANARYFLAAVYAKQGDLKSALAQIQAISDMSAENATALATQLTALKEGRNPFPANLLSINPAPVK